MATSVVSGTTSFAVLPMSANPMFWEVFSRSGTSGTWTLVTPPGIADNGGLVVSPSAANALTVAVRPSQDLEFSPLAVTANSGGTWTSSGPLSGSVAASPDSFAADGSDLAALLTDGTIEISYDGGTSWSTLAKPGAIADSPAAKGCGAFEASALSFETSPGTLLMAGTCGISTSGNAGGTDAVFFYSATGGWQRTSPPVTGQLIGLNDGTALVQGRSGLSAEWSASDGQGFGQPAFPQPPNWTNSTPLPLSGTVTTSGTLADGSTWVLLSGGRAATANPLHPQWSQLPTVPVGTSVLASGPNGATDALAVSGSTLTVWQLTPGATAWSKTQSLSVPIQYGTSS